MEEMDDEGNFSGFLARVKTVFSIGGASRPNDNELSNVCFNGKVEEVRALLAAGANVNATEGNDVTPMYMASQQGHADLVKLLLAAGANVNAACIDGTTPLLQAPKTAMPT